MSDLIFKGEMINGKIDLDNVEMVCVPSKPIYAEVDLCLKDGMNIVIAQIEGRCLSFEQKQKLGYEIVKRSNAHND